MNVETEEMTTLPLYPYLLQGQKAFNIFKLCRLVPDAQSLVESNFWFSFPPLFQLFHAVES